MRMVRWMCGVKLKDRLPSKELRERLGIYDIALVLQQNRLRWYAHVLRKDDWEKKCMEYEVEGPRPRLIHSVNGDGSKTAKKSLKRSYYSASC